MVVVLLPHQQSLLSEKNLQIFTAVQSFHVIKIKCTMQNLIQNIESGFLVFDCVFVVPFLLVIQMWENWCFVICFSKFSTLYILTDFNTANRSNVRKEQPNTVKQNRMSTLIAS